MKGGVRVLVRVRVRELVVLVLRELVVRVLVLVLMLVMCVQVRVVLRRMKSWVMGVSLFGELRYVRLEKLSLLLRLLALRRASLRRLVGGRVRVRYRRVGAGCLLLLLGCLLLLLLLLLRRGGGELRKRGLHLERVQKRVDELRRRVAARRGHRRRVAHLRGRLDELGGALVELLLLLLSHGSCGGNYSWRSGLRVDANERLANVNVVGALVVFVFAVVVMLVLVRVLVFFVWLLVLLLLVLLLHCDVCRQLSGRLGAGCV